MADETPARLKGLVEIVNTCGNVSTLSGTECQPKPASIPLELYTPSGDVPTYSFSSDGNGRFEVSVEPGRYRLVPKTPQFLEGYPEEVDLTAGQNSEVTLRLYSKIQ